MKGQNGLISMIETDKFKKVQIHSSAELRSWLKENHKQEESIWLVTYKKSTPDKYVSREQVLDELLCFGWIDGIRRKLDDEKTMQLISKRRVEHWAGSYKKRAEKLIEQNLMEAAGFESIEISKRNGLWNFMDDVDRLIIPKDLEVKLNSFKGATEYFATINDSSKRFVLRWIKLAKTDKTRQNRIDKVSLLASKGQKLPGS